MLPRVHAPGRRVPPSAGCLQARIPFALHFCVAASKGQGACLPAVSPSMGQLSYSKTGCPERQPPRKDCPLSLGFSSPRRLHSKEDAGFLRRRKDFRLRCYWGHEQVASQQLRCAMLLLRLSQRHRHQNRKDYWTKRIDCFAWPSYTAAPDLIQTSELVRARARACALKQARIGR